MAVSSIHGFKTAPGRLADHLATTAEGLEHLHRMGLQAVMLQPMAGTDVGTLSTVVTYESMAAYATAMQTVTADEGWQEFWARAAGEGAAEPVEVSILNDLDPTWQPSPDRPLGVILGIQWRAKPGRAADFIGQVMTAVPHIERMGGTVRVMQSILGPHPMTTMVATTFADLDAFGAYSDTANGDEQWQAFWADAMTDPTADIVRSGLYLNIGA